MQARAEEAQRALYTDAASFEVTESLSVEPHSPHIAHDHVIAECIQYDKHKSWWKHGGT